jgi:RNA polymerase sigma factor (sigma-70 family)
MQKGKSKNRIVRWLDLFPFRIATASKRLARFRYSPVPAAPFSEGLMDNPDPYGEWVIRGNEPAEQKASFPWEQALQNAAREAWPHVLAYARRELSKMGLGLDETAVAGEVWEGVVKAVSRALMRRGANVDSTQDLQPYLIRAFHHRFNRFLKPERRRLQTIRYVPSTADLDRMASARDTRWVSDLERAITVKEIIAYMDDWTRKVWGARQYGYSWKEIAKRLGLSEQQAKMRFRYGLEKTKKLVVELLRAQKPAPPDEQ